MVEEPGLYTIVAPNVQEKNDQFSARNSCAKLSCFIFSASYRILDHEDLREHALYSIQCFKYISVDKWSFSLFKTPVFSSSLSMAIYSLIAITNPKNISKSTSTTSTSVTLILGGTILAQNFRLVSALNLPIKHLRLKAQRTLLSQVFLLYIFLMARKFTVWFILVLLVTFAWWHSDMI